MSAGSRQRTTTWVPPDACFFPALLEMQRPAVSRARNVSFITRIKPPLVQTARQLHGALSRTIARVREAAQSFGRKPRVRLLVQPGDGILPLLKGIIGAK